MGKKRARKKTEEGKKERERHIIKGGKRQDRAPR